jgi:AcrR family transcriptional regulator
VAEPRRRRANGEASRQRILDAATEVAGERGYEGTSISLVSDRSGLPASSIYWHFKDKDELMAAVVDRAFSRWAETLERPVIVAEGASEEDLFRMELHRTCQALAHFPDFLRLGLMLILERRPHQPTARARFIQVRDATTSRLTDLYHGYFVHLDTNSISGLVTLTMALVDGLFVAGELDGVALDEACDLMATAILGAADRLRRVDARAGLKPLVPRTSA